ncbi:MAG: chaperone NapD [Deltaproteobacteria bacterium]|jgi:nitrate reductase NapAB chaperone NapD|nr:chaperone NapD [Deltaproteobacteria bacterium]
MPILSYLALPQAGAMDQLCSDLSAIDYCEIIPSDNEEVVVLVTDTPDEKSEKNLQKILKSLPSIQSLSMTFGHNAELNNN